MKALQGVEGHVEWLEEPSPTCDVGQVRIRVAAAGLNRADLLQRAGLYPPPPGVSKVLGLECSGVISEVGAGSSWQVGDRVCALLAGGGMAEEVVVDARHVLPVPEGLSLIEAAALPEVYSTAWLNLFQLAGAQARREGVAACRRQWRGFGGDPVVQGIRQPVLGQRRLGGSAWPTVKPSAPRAAWSARTVSKGCGISGRSM